MTIPPLAWMVDLELLKEMRPAGEPRQDKTA
jgi:hypothetical protein